MTTPEKIEVPGGLDDDELILIINDWLDLANNTSRKSEHRATAKARAEYLQSLLPKEPK